MRTYRKSGRWGYEYTPQSKARAILNVYVRRGKIGKLPCHVCGTEKVEAHHADYSKPLRVVWICKKHHDMVTQKKLSIYPR